MHTRRDPEAGVSLIELLTVILILGILAAIAIPIYVGVSEQAQAYKTVQADVHATKQNLKAALAKDKTIHSGTTFEQVGAPVQNSQIPHETVSVLVQSEHEILVLGKIGNNPRSFSETLRH